MRSCFRSLGSMVAVFALVAAGTVITDHASASAVTTCGNGYKHKVSTPSGSETVLVQNCPIWMKTPVYKSITNHKVVGYLSAVGSKNWFICEERGPKVTAHGYASTDYATTEADNGKVGWASAVYYGGASPNWVHLRTCG